MTDQNELSFDEFDEIDNPGPAATGFEEVVDRAVTRRGFLGGSVALGTAAFISGLGALGTGTARANGRLAFEAVPANTLDTVTLPPGYSWHVVARWGEPLWSTGAEFDQETRGTGESQERAFGDNTDGMFIYSDAGRHVMAINNEYTNRSIIFGNRESEKPEEPDDIRKGKAAHGISVVEVVRTGGKWSIVKDSPLNRRITADTPMEFTGPARGHDLLKTAADPEGTTSLGTWNNCGSGRTPWGTYLTCEENFNGYFSSSDSEFERTPAMKRYGVKHKDWGYKWAMTDERFDISKHPNEPNRAGYVVEVDPWDPNSTPRKLTALGRMKHENAEVVLAPNGQVVVYMGDDERGEFIYRFVSHGNYAANGDNAGLLETGKLCVAKFNDDLRGEWVELTPEATGLSSQAEICIHTRQAGSAVGATTMDRPEWIAANPRAAEFYCALTNNKHRGKRKNAGGDDVLPNAANPRTANDFGQIIRWRPDGGEHTAAGFAWDLFVLAGNPEVLDYEYAGSENVTPQNMFNSPDGIVFDSNGLLWIQTDGNDSNKREFEGMGNNQMLIGDPVTGEIRRFMVGPKECEVTGLTFSRDRKTAFVGIQHPGADGGGHFPDGGESVPRSTVIAITRDDGGLIG